MLSAHSLRAMVFALAFAAAHAAVFAEPISAQEAEAILRKAKAAGWQTGSFRQETTRKSKAGTTTTTTLIRRDSGSSRLARAESVFVPDKNPEQRTVRVTLDNEEGHWQLFGNKAVLVPRLAGNNELKEAIDGSPLIAGGTAEKKKEAAAKRTAAMEAAKAMASHIIYSGERVTEGGKHLVRVTRTYDEKAQQFLRDFAEEKLGDVKKQLSLGKRMLLSTVVAAKGGIGSLLPAKEVYTIDEERGRVILTEEYKSNGDLLNKRESGPEPVRIEDLPLETFALPAGVTAIRPKTVEEALEITDKLREEERKQRK